MIRLTALLFCFSLFAQRNSSLLNRDEFLENWKTSKEFTIAVADAMPERLYGFKPNPEEMSFGGLMVHIAESNIFRFAQVSGEKPPPFEPPVQWTKTMIIDRLRDSFDYCARKLQLISDEQLKKQYPVDWYQRPSASGSQVLLGMYVHTAHHRGQAEVYLRVNNLKPPAYRP